MASKLENLIKKEKRLIAPGLLFIVMMFLLSPVVSRIKLKLENKKTLDKTVSVLQEKLNTLEGVDRNLINKRVQKMEEVFPSKKPIVNLLTSLSNLASVNNLDFSGIVLHPGSLSEDVKKSSLKKKGIDKNLYDLGFKFKLTGDFNDVTDFMNRLEETAPLMKINEVDIKVKSTPVFDKDNVTIVASIGVSAYYKFPPKELGLISKPIELLSVSQERSLNKLTGFKTFKAILPIAPTGKKNLFLQGL